MKICRAYHAQLRIALSLFLLLGSVRAHGALVATDDNYVRKNQGLQGTGSETTFELKEASTSQTNARFAFLKFDLSSILESALNEGSFTVTSTVSASTNYTLKAFALNDSAPGYNWSEGSITYANRPAPSNSANLVDTTLATAIGSEILVSGLNSNTAAGTKYSFSFADLENFRQPDDTITFILLVTTQSNTTPSFSFASSENGTIANRPSLEVTAIPEPATTALWGLGLLGIFVWKRRQ